MKKIISTIIVLSIAIGIFTGCSNTEVKTSKEPEKYNVITTTTMLQDMVKVLGGNYVNVSGLMGPGIDPHLYKASAGDVSILQKADMVVYTGLHLEGKLGEVFENLSKGNKLVIEASSGIDKSKLLESPLDANLHDPHIWFDVMLWKDVTRKVTDGLIQLDAKHKEEFEKNYIQYGKELDKLDAYVKARAKEVPEKYRVIVTAHDAFSYFGKAYGFEVKGLQGISTASEAGSGDVSNLSNFIVSRKIKAVFVESSVPKKNIEALTEAVKSKGFDVTIGGQLYSDSLGSAGTPEESYIGTVKSNIDTIVNALK